MSAAVAWQGVFPAVTTQFREDHSLDIDATTRVIGYLLRDIAADSKARVTVSLPVGKATIASRLSLTPEYFSRVLHELDVAALVRIERREIHILDAQALANYRSP